MITQQINISFTSAMAETIRIHTGESGRQIIFTPDFLEAIPNDHEADMIIVKPDNTFVIALASIGTDGKIYVTIPEQAGAVSGVGNYILKVYDNENLCIYSACGGFYIDDHLLTDEMLESIAEVYGYQFPQDFALILDDETSTTSTWSSAKIADEIATASPDIIDDNEVLYDKTWSSEKISYELGNVPGFHVYTTTEQAAGRWIDGKTLYEKTFTATNPSAVTVSGCNAYKIAEITDVDTAMFEIGVVTDDVEHRKYSLPYDRYYSGPDKIIPEVYVDEQSHTMIAYVTCPLSGGFTMSKVELTILYTKFSS